MKINKDVYVYAIVFYLAVYSVIVTIMCINYIDRIDKLEEDNQKLILDYDRCIWFNVVQVIKNNPELFDANKYFNNSNYTNKTDNPFWNNSFMD